MESISFIRTDSFLSISSISKMKSQAKFLKNLIAGGGLFLRMPKQQQQRAGQIYRGHLCKERKRTPIRQRAGRRDRGALCEKKRI